MVDIQSATADIRRGKKEDRSVTVVPPMYQLVLVAATEGSIFHVIVTAADCDGSSSTLYSSPLASYTTIRLLCYNTYTRLNFAKIYTQVNTTHEDERRTLRLYKGLDGHVGAMANSDAFLILTKTLATSDTAHRHIYEQLSIAATGPAGN